MSVFDQLMEQARGIDLAAVAQRVGLTPDQVAAGARALMPQIADPTVDNHQATADVAAQTGIGHAQLSAMLPAILEQARSLGAQGGPFANVLAGLGGGGSAPAEPAAPVPAPAAGGSVLDQIKSAVDRDGDGNPVNDIMNMFKR